MSFVTSLPRFMLHVGFYSSTPHSIVLDVSRVVFHTAGAGCDEKLFISASLPHKTTHQENDLVRDLFKNLNICYSLRDIHQMTL